MYARCLEINDNLDVDAVVSQIKAGYAQESIECKESNTSEEKENSLKICKVSSIKQYMIIDIMIIFDNFPFNATKIFRSTTYFSSLID